MRINLHTTGNWKLLSGDQIFHPYLELCVKDMGLDDKGNRPLLKERFQNPIRLVLSQIEDPTHTHSENPETTFNV